MQLTREDFQKFLYTYNEDELFYRTLYFEKKEHPETFHKFCLNLDCDLISRRQLYVPELQKEGWHSYFEEKAMFCDTADNIMLYKHYRYTPEFIHEHEFFEILCIYDGQAHTSIQGIVFHDLFVHLHAHGVQLLGQGNQVAAAGKAGVAVC